MLTNHSILDFAIVCHAAGWLEATGAIKVEAYDELVKAAEEIVKNAAGYPKSEDDGFDFDEFAQAELLKRFSI